MESKTEVLWAWLEQWSPVGFVVTGVGFLGAVALLVADTVAAVTISELLVSVFVVPSLLALFLVGLPGFYPYVADASPRLALGGVVAAIAGGTIVAVMTGAKIALDLLGVVGFTEEGPLVFGFILAFMALFLSVLFYGVASTRSGEPTRTVGLLLLLIIVEPAAVIVNDLVGIDVGVVVAFGTLGVAGIAFLAIGYILQGKSISNRRTEPSQETAT